MKNIEVVAAVIIENSKMFVAQRGYGEFKSFYEIPGGKVEINESKEDALIREIKEELEVQIAVEKFLTTIDYTYPQFHLTMHCYECKIIDGNIKLVEHDQAKWLGSEELESVNWLPADILLLDKFKEVLTIN